MIYARASRYTGRDAWNDNALSPRMMRFSSNFVEIRHEARIGRQRGEQTAPGGGGWVGGRGGGMGRITRGVVQLTPNRTLHRDGTVVKASAALVKASGAYAKQVHARKNTCTYVRATHTQRAATRARARIRSHSRTRTHTPARKHRSCRLGVHQSRGRSDGVRFKYVARGITDNQEVCKNNIQKNDVISALYPRIVQISISGLFCATSLALSR